MRDNPEVYDSAKRKFLALNELTEAYKYRELILQLTRRDILTRYKRSALGMAWTMLNPLGMMLVLSFAFSHLLRFQVEGNYSLYILSGLITWNFLSQTTTACLNSLVWGGQLFQRIYMPKSVFAFSSILTGLINWVFALIPLILITLVVNKSLSWTILTAPFSMLLLSLFALGVGLIISALGIFFYDVVEMYQLGLLAWMYLTPIIYPAQVIPPNWQWVIKLNPMTWFVQLFRDAVFYNRLPLWGEVWPALAWSIGVLVIGWIFFASRSKEFAYRA